MTTERAETTLDILLDFVKRTRGFDFTATSARPSSAASRSGWASSASSSYDDYVDYLEVHPEEFEPLFNTILINVTGFFRDAATWEYLAGDVVPQLLAARPPDARSGSGAPGARPARRPTRSRWCSPRRWARRRSGAGEDLRHGRRRGGARPRRATAPTRHRRGGRPARCARALLRARRPRYTFRKDLRRTVIFGRNDLVQDAPISRIDLLVCRNTLMYFNAETQSRILRRLHFALDDEGVLLLGKSEMLLTHADLFRPADLKRRIFHKVVRPTMRDRVRVMATRSREPARRRGRPTRCARARSTSRAARSSSSTATGRSRWPTTARAGCSASPPRTSAATSTIWISPTARSSSARGSSGSPRTASRSRSRG